MTACAAVVYLLPLTFTDPTADLNTPETAMNGMMRVNAAGAYFMSFLLCAFLLAIIAIAHLSFVRSRALAVVPCLFLLPLYASMRDRVAEIENIRCFRESFYASESSLDELARQIESGAPPVMPTPVGRFTIVGYEKLNGGIALFTKLDSAGRNARWGFVRLPATSWDSGRAGAAGFAGEVGENNGVTRIGGDWFVLFDTYTYIKTGWS